MEQSAINKKNDSQAPMPAAGDSNQPVTSGENNSVSDTADKNCNKENSPNVISSLNQHATDRIDVCSEADDENRVEPTEEDRDEQLNNLRDATNSDHPGYFKDDVRPA